MESEELLNFMHENKNSFFHLVLTCHQAEINLEDFMYMCAVCYETCPYPKIKKALEKDENLNSL